MQVQPNKNATTLQQGSVFTLNNLEILKDEKPSKLFGDGSFYPEVKYDPSDLGLVFSQSCDIYRNKEEGRKPKVPYINVGLLETFEKYFKSSAVEFDFKIDIATYSYRMLISSEEQTRTYRFFNSAAMEKRFEKVFEKIVQNNHDYLFFINFAENDNGEDLFVTNLLKIFPVKLKHYDSILNCVTHEMKAEFANKLGWRIASLYGQIGTTDYKESQLKDICKTLNKKFANGLKEPDCNDLFVKAEDFEQAKVIGNLGSTEKLEFLQKITHSYPS